MFVTFRPSTDKQMSVLFLEYAFNFTCFSPSIKIGFAANECEQIGVRHTHFIVGSITGPPADIEYAVEPVGVAAIRPSA